MAGLAIGAVGRAAGPPDGSTPDQVALVASDPAFAARQLVLQDLPKPVASAQRLFNGRNLEGWDVWLGNRKPEETYAPKLWTPIGLNRDTTHVFSVVEEDGAPALLANGRIWGGLLTRKSYGNYHRRLQYTWGRNQWMPIPRNNGVLYHSNGPYGAFFGTFMQSLEFEIVPHHVGMLVTVAQSTPGKLFDGIHQNVSAKVAVGQDKGIPYPWRRYMPGSAAKPVAGSAFNVDAHSDPEKPIGEWNTLDLYVLGDRSVHVVNGVPVLAAEGLATRAGPGKPSHPLTHGRIQLQSEGAETYFRNIRIEPIGRLPVGVVAD